LRAQQDGDASQSQQDIQLWARALLGIRHYQNFPSPEHTLVRSEYWRQGELSLQTVRSTSSQERAQSATAPLLLLVPSLINKSHILDLTPQRSLLRFFENAGIESYLLDWGNLRNDPDLQTMDNVVQRGVIAAAHEITRQRGRPVMLMGYCMGGTLNVAALCLRPELFCGSVFLATPWDFQAGRAELARVVKFWAPSALPHIHTHGYLPSDWMQSVFIALDPQQSVHKFARFSDMKIEDPAAELFVAVEDWLNDGIDLPAPLALSCLKEWFIDNALVRGGWRMNGHTIRPSDIKHPCLLVAAENDRLVEPENALSLARSIPHADVQMQSCGHVSLIAGRTAPEKIWTDIAQWIVRIAKEA
jgi:polyhydroxyalkanoate synthase